jgi:hypothetical protein
MEENADYRADDGSGRMEEGTDDGTNDVRIVPPSMGRVGRMNDRGSTTRSPSAANPGP